MKTRVAFANEIARIAKYWFKSLKCSTQFDGISGANTCIELVAVYAARKGYRRNRKFNPYLKAFIRFLESLIEFDELDVVFGICNRLLYPANYMIPRGTPRVIDPVNPYNNYASYWKYDEISMLKDCASITYKRLCNLILNANYSEDDMIDTLFHNN